MESRGRDPLLVNAISSSSWIRTSEMLWNRLCKSFCRHRVSRRRTPSASLRQRAPIRLAADDRGNGVRRCRPAKHRLPREQLEQHAAKGPDVGPFVAQLTARLLGTHVGGCAHHDAGGRLRRPVDVAANLSRQLERLRQSKIQDLDDAARRDLDVGRLQIAMDDALLVRGFERFGDLPANFQASRIGSGPRTNWSASVGPSTSSSTIAGVWPSSSRP